MFYLSERISRDRTIFQEVSEKWKNISDGKMQKLLKCLQQEIENGESTEIPEKREELRLFCEGNLQEIKEWSERAQSNDNSGEICGVVRIPTEEMLLLWYRREKYSKIRDCVQCESYEIDNRQIRFIEGIRRGEFGSLLLAVQSYEEQLFYSIGDGKMHSKIKLYFRGRGRRKILPITGADGENSIQQLGHKEAERENPNAYRVYSPNGLSPCLGTMQGGGREPSIAFPCFVDMTIGKGVNLTENARTLCARYQKGMTNHEGTTSGIAIKIIGEVNSSQDGQVHDISGIAKCHSAGHNNSPKVAIPVLTPDRAEKRQNGRRFKENGDPMFTLTAQDRHGVSISPLGCLRTTRSEYGKKIRKDYETGKLKVSRHTFLEHEVRTDGCSNTIDSVQKDNLAALKCDVHGD